MVEPDLPSLNGSADGAKDDGEVEDLGLSPLVKCLVCNSNLLFLCDARHGGEIDGFARDERTLDEQGLNIFEAVFCSEIIDIGNACFFTHVQEWVLNPGDDINKD